MNISSDDRRLGFFDLFPTPGQVNIVHLRKGKICAWHRHGDQVDHYFCVSGVVKVGMIPPESEPIWWVLDEHHPMTVSVPVGWWHGYMALAGNAVLLQYLDQKYNPDDEERHPIDD